MTESPAERDYRRIEAAIGHLVGHYQEQPSLAEMADAAGLSPAHFQRLFTRWAGLSPTRFMQYLTLAHAKAVLARSGPVLEAALDAGLSGPGRLHDLFVSFEALSPGEFKRQGEGVTIRTAIHPSPFGPIRLAASPRGLCGLSFLGEGDESTQENWRRRWPLARFVEDPSGTADLAARIFPDRRGKRAGPLALHIAGTNFQVKVWEALMRVPAGGLVAYNDLARALGRARAPRAIGNALASNPLAYLIPCHRVIRQSGAFNDYRWGTARKLALIGWEQATAQSPSTSFIE